MNKKTKIIIMCLTLTITFVYWITRLIVVISYFANPSSFSFIQLIITVVLMFIMMAHWAYYVHIMNDKPRKHKFIDDDENWWEKWDRV